MMLFALSCLALVLFLWFSFGGTIPLKPEGYRVDLATLSRELGLGAGTGRHSAVARTVSRLVRFDLAEIIDDRLGVSTSLPPLTPRQAASELGVSPATLAVWRCHKRYPLRYIKVGSKVRYRLTDIYVSGNYCAINWRADRGVVEVGLRHRQGSLFLLSLGDRLRDLSLGSRDGRHSRIVVGFRQIKLLLAHYIFSGETDCTFIVRLGLNLGCLRFYQVRFRGGDIGFGVGQIRPGL